MVTLERARQRARAVSGLPLLVAAGLIVMALGGAFDIVVHLGPRHDDGHAAFHLEEHLAHLVGVAGMVLIWTGVVLSGVRRQFRRVTVERSRT